MTTRREFFEDNSFECVFTLSKPYTQRHLNSINNLYEKLPVFRIAVENALLIVKSKTFCFQVRKNGIVVIPEALAPDDNIDYSNVDAEMRNELWETLVDNLYLIYVKVKHQVNFFNEQLTDRFLTEYDNQPEVEKEEEE